MTLLVARSAKDPIAIQCPVAGVFKFRQTGYLPFETRILGGITDSPRPQIHCLDSISSVKVCDSQQRIIEIDAELCLSVDTYGRPVDIYSKERISNSSIPHFLSLPIVVPLLHGIVSKNKKVTNDHLRKIFRNGLRVAFSDIFFFFFCIHFFIRVNSCRK